MNPYKNYIRDLGVKHMGIMSNIFLIKQKAIKMNIGFTYVAYTLKKKY